MKASTAKKSGAVLGAVALAGMGAAGVAGYVGAVESTGSPVYEAPSQQEAPKGGVVSVANVEGSFSYDQNTVSSVSYVSEVFNKAAAVLCSALPDYGMVQHAPLIAVGGDVDNAFEATVDEMASEEGSKSFVLACACASNVPGGGAIANAEVSGVSLESIAHMAGA